MSHQPAFQTLFPVTPPKGFTVRIYHPRPWKNAYAYIEQGVVTHVSEELVFALGWTRDKLVARAEKVGFSVSRQINMSKPRDTWISARPAPVQVPLPPPIPSGFPKGTWDLIPHPPMPMPVRDSKGRFVSSKPKKEKK